MLAVRQQRKPLFGHKLRYCSGLLHDSHRYRAIQSNLPFAATYSIARQVNTTAAISSAYQPIARKPANFTYVGERSFISD